jgi:uncharacterized protein YqgC (DUF456 family)
MDWQLVLGLAMIILGFLGALLPALPGVPLMFSGMLLIAWLDGFTRVSGITLAVLGVLALMAWAIDFFASYATAKRAGASKYALWGILIGAVIGVFAGVAGLLIGPVLGAIVGELLAHRDPQRATTVGLAAGLGFAIALMGKVLLSAIMLGLFAYSYYF